MTYELPRVLDNSILSSFRSCETLGRWRYLEHLRPMGMVSKHLVAGGAFARGREVLYKALYEGKTQAEAHSRAEFAFLQAWGDAVVDETEAKSKTRTLEALWAYEAYYKPPNDYIVPYAPDGNLASAFEHTFAIPLDHDHFGIDFPLHPTFNEPFLYAGRFDMLGTDRGLLRIVDDKTASAIGKTWSDNFNLRSQFMGYIASMQSLGFDVDTVEARGIGILKTEFKIGGAFNAVKTYPPHLIDAWKRQTYKTVWRMVEAVRTGDFDQDFGEVCTSYGSCEFMDLCRVADPSSYFHYYDRVVWNPLTPLPPITV